MRYQNCADELDELSLHLSLEGRDFMSRQCQLAASELRTTKFVPPDPSRLDDVSVHVRDYIAEWMAFGEIEELQEMRAKHPYLTELTQIAKVGPQTAKSINDETGAETIDDVRELADDDKLEDISGIGPKTATTIRRSIAQLDR